MRVTILLFFSISIAFFGKTVQAQTVLFQEKFNNCILPSGWQVNVTGNPLVQWYVGTAQNPLIQNQSLDGTCFLFIDDNSLGLNSDGYQLDFVSPPFNASQFETVELSLDVHFRHAANSQQTFDVLVTDGSSEYLLNRLYQYRSNSDQLSDFFSLRYDLSMVTRSSSVRLILRYKDSAGDLGWWAGVDNIKVTGSGSGAVVLGEAFAKCAKPVKWETSIVTGQYNWQFGLLPSSSAAANHGNSMDGSCFAFFDDDGIGGQAQPSTIRLSSPWFNAMDYFTYSLDFDLILRYTGESIRVYLENDQGLITELFKSTGHVGGPWFPDYVHHMYDLTPYRATQLRIVFEYSDNGVFGYWVGLDNIKVVGKGAALDFCNHAVEIFTDELCVPGNNTTALFDGPPANCSSRAVSSLWYRWKANFDGVAQLNTNADFNEIVNVYTNGCANPTSVLCNNRDEHGFTGETTFFQATKDVTYYFRISGQADGFGLPRGAVCVEITQADAFPSKPANDDCSKASPLTINGPCVDGNNRNAGMSAVLPSLNELARADVWYKFTATALAPDEQFQVKSNASFSDIITVYSGNCAALAEVAGNHKGSSLDLPALTPGQEYLIQIAGNFATVEGSLCPTVAIKQSQPVPNDDCLSAIPVNLGVQCVADNNSSAAFSGYQPGCAVRVDQDIWFKFTAPNSGSVQINTGAKFEHILAVWTGDCANLKPVYCIENPLRCQGFVTVGSLVPGQTYYIQIASWESPGGLSTGSVCLKVLDGQAIPDFNPLELKVLQPCVGIDSARLYVEVIGGVLPYTFAADMHGQIIPSGQPFAVIVMDGMGCEIQVFDTAQACASNTCTATTSIEKTEPGCFGATNGVLTASVHGATGPLEFKWSNGVNTAENAGLAAGTYTLTVTETNGCVETLTVTLSQPSAIQLTTIVTPVSCFGSANGSVTLTSAGGSPGYSFLWSNDASTQNLTNLLPGAYTVTVTDSKGCSATRSAIVNTPLALNMSLTPDAISCFGKSDGAISAALIGGTPSYTYLWSNGLQTKDIGNLPAGTYTLTVTDSKNCTIVKSTVVSEPPALQLSTSTTDAGCFGSANGAINLTVSGGTPGYYYLWSNGQNVQDLVNIPAGPYQVTVTDLRNCTATATAIVEGATQILMGTVVDSVSCFGRSDGAVSLTINGPTTGFEYNWSGGQTTQDLTNVPVGTYTVTITNPDDCTATASATVTGPAPLQLVATPAGVSCNGGSNGIVNLLVSGGTADYTYLWSDGQTTQNISGLPAGSYTVTVTDAHACTASLSSSVGQPALLEYSAAPIPASCFGGSDGAIQVSVSGGTPVYTYLWSTGAKTKDLTDVPAGIYSVTITDKNGCTGVSEALISEPVALVLTTDSTHNPVQGQSDGSISISVDGGTPPYSYTWYLNGTTYLSDQEDLDSLAAGQYSLLVTDSLGCKLSSFFILTETVSAGDLSQAPFQVTVFPNPAHSQLTVSIQAADPQNFNCFLIDPLGRVVLRQTPGFVREVQLLLDVQQVPAGAYIIRIIADQEALSRQVLIQH